MVGWLVGWSADGSTNGVFILIQHLLPVSSLVCCFRSPTFAGGVFLISRNWFFKLKAFNTRLEVGKCFVNKLYFVLAFLFPFLLLLLKFNF